MAEAVFAHQKVPAGTDTLQVGSRSIRVRLRLCPACEVLLTSEILPQTRDCASELPGPIHRCVPGMERRAWLAHPC